jgi:dCMP deaminase
MKPVSLTLKWVLRFLDTARHVAGWSKDPNTKVGAVAVRDRAILETGYNGLPAGVDDLPHRMERPAKYDWTAHAETNLVAHAARARLLGSTVHVTHLCCSTCAASLINAGVAEVVCAESDTSTSMPPEKFEIARTMFYEAGVRLRIVCEGEETVFEPRQPFVQEEAA